MNHSHNRLQAADAARYGEATVLHIFVVRRKPDKVKRNPLHPKALTMEELSFGLKVATYHRDGVVENAVIAGNPYQDDNGVWMVKVLRQIVFSDDAILETWYLAHRGITSFPSGDWTPSFVLAV